MKSNIQIGIARLIRNEQHGDWHDMPTRYVVFVESWTNPLTQKFSKLKDAQTWASCVRRGNADWNTTDSLWRATWK